MPDAAWSLTPRELAYHIEGERRRREEAYEVFAHFTACLLTALAGKRRRIRGRDIYRPTRRGPAPSRSQLEEMFAETVAIMGPEARPVERGGGRDDGGGHRPGGR